MRLLSLVLCAASALAVTYEGQSYAMTFNSPNANTPWFTGGYNTINVTTIQTLICCPPLPPVTWVLRNQDTSLLAHELTLQDRGNLTPPENPPIDGAHAGQGYVIAAVLSTDPSQVFATSEAFAILDGSTSPPLISPPINSSQTPTEPNAGTNDNATTIPAQASGSAPAGSGTGSEGMPSATSVSAAPAPTGSTNGEPSASHSGSEGAGSSPTGGASSGSAAPPAQSGTSSGSPSATSSTPPKTSPSSKAYTVTPAVALLAAAAVLAIL